MAFRLRPSSKKSNDTENSLVQFPKPQTFISNEVMTLKQIINKTDILQNNLNLLTEGIRRQREISSAGYIQVQKRLDVLQYKSFANEKDIQQLAEINRANYNSLPPLKKQQSQSLSKNQVTILKQTLLQQRQSQKQQSKHMSQTLEQLSIKQLRLQQQLREMFNKVCSQYQERINQQNQQIQRVDQFKTRKIDNQYELMRENMQIMEKKIVEELEGKLRKEMLIKEYVQEQTNLVKQELIEEQRSFISTEVKLTREMKQSFQSLYAMISQMKLSFGEELSQTQQLTTNNIKRLAMNLDVIDGKYQQKFHQVQEETKQWEQQVVNFKQWVIAKLDENRQIVMGLQEQAIQRMQNTQGRVMSQGISGTQSSVRLEQKFRHLQKEFQGWKSSIEQKNLTIFKQISQTLKQMKLDYKKQNDEFSSQIISLTQSQQQLKKSLPNDMKKISQTIVTIFNDEFDVLAQELDLVTEMIKVAKNEGEKFTENEIKKNKEEFAEEIKGLIQAAQKQVMLSFQKSIIKSEQSFKNSLQKESLFIQSLFNQRLDRLQAITQQLQSQSKKLNTNTTNQLENFTLSMKQFNQNYKEYLEQQRKEDLKKRIQLQENMRKNASNLMDIAYKKSEFLVQGMKKAIEMNEMKKDLQTKQTIENVKDDLLRSNQHQKQETFVQIKSLENKLKDERKKSEEQLQESLNQSINTLKKTVGIQIGNTKLQIEEKMSEFQKQVEQKLLKQRQLSRKTDQRLQFVKNEVKQNLQKLKQSEQKINVLKTQLAQNLQKLKAFQKEQIQTKLKLVQQKLQTLQKTLTEETYQKIKNLNQKQIQFQLKQTQLQQSMAKLKQEIQTKTSEKQRQLEKTLNKLKQQIQIQNAKQKQSEKVKLDQLKADFQKQINNQFAQAAQKSEQALKQYDQTLTTLRESVWKLQAMNFSEQAKNKAILDKMNEDLNLITVNLDSIRKQIKNEQKT